MTPFEGEFHHFLEHDLNGLAVQSLEEETVKTTERLPPLYHEQNQICYVNQSD